MSTKKRRRPRGHTPPVWLRRERVRDFEHVREMTEALTEQWGEQMDREVRPLAAESIGGAA